MASNFYIAVLPGGRVFRYYFRSANRYAFNFFLKHLTVAASRISTGVSFHNFIAECLKPFLHVPYLFLGFEDHGYSLFHILSLRHLNQMTDFSIILTTGSVYVSSKLVHLLHYP